MVVLVYIQIPLCVKKNDMSSTVTEVGEELKDNNIKSTYRQCHNCKEQFCISKAVSSKSSIPLSEIW